MMKNIYFTSLLLTVMIFFNSCKKDFLNIDKEKSYVQIEPKVQATSSYFGAWSLTLYPSGVVDVNPGGDIVYRGTFKTSGSSLKVKTDFDSYDFKILSATDIRSNKYNVLLRLKN